MSKSRRDYTDHAITSDGTVDAFRPVLLDENGKLDATLIDAATLDASTLLASIKTVDGAGSGLDADLLDGVTSLAFLKADGSVALTANWAAGAFKITVKGLALSGDAGGTASQITFTNVSSGVSTGNGTTKMNGSTARNSTGWIKIYDGTNARYIPFWTTITG